MIIDKKKTKFNFHFIIKIFNFYYKSYDHNNLFMASAVLKCNEITITITIN